MNPSKMNIEQLKELCQEYRLKTRGTRAKLLNQLVDFTETMKIVKQMKVSIESGNKRDLQELFKVSSVMIQRVIDAKIDPEYDEMEVIGAKIYTEVVEDEAAVIDTKVEETANDEEEDLNEEDPESRLDQRCRIYKDALIAMKKALIKKSEENLAMRYREPCD